MIFQVLVCAGVVFPRSIARLRPESGVCLARVTLCVFFTLCDVLLCSDFSLVAFLKQRHNLKKWREQGKTEGEKIL